MIYCSSSNFNIKISHKSVSWQWLKAKDTNYLWGCKTTNLIERWIGPSSHCCSSLSAAVRTSFIYLGWGWGGNLTATFSCMKKRNHQKHSLFYAEPVTCWSRIITTCDLVHSFLNGERPWKCFCLLLTATANFCN